MDSCEGLLCLLCVKAHTSLVCVLTPFTGALLICCFVFLMFDAVLHVYCSYIAGPVHLFLLSWNFFTIPLCTTYMYFKIHWLLFQKYGFQCIDRYKNVQQGKGNTFLSQNTPSILASRNGNPLFNSLPKRQNFRLVQIESICRRHNKCC